MATEADTKKLFKCNSSLNIYHYMFCNKEAIIKDYSISRHSNIDLILKIKKKQIITEAKAILKCKTIGVAVPTLYLIDTNNYKIIMENVSGLPIYTFLKDNYNNPKSITGVLFEIGIILSKLHKSDVSHGDLNTYNMLIKENGSIVLINFGLSCLDPSINEKAMDLYILEQSFINMHWEIADKFWLILTSYKEYNETDSSVIYDKFNRLKTTIMMVNSTSENKSPYTRLGSKNELTPTKYKNTIENSPEKNGLHTLSPIKNSSKSVTKINTITEKPSVETKMNNIKNNIFPLCEINLKIRRIDETNYISMLSPRSLKVLEEKKELSNTSHLPTSSQDNLKKSPQFSEHNENDVIKLDGNLAISNDTDKLFNSPKKCSKTNSVFSSYSINSYDEVIITNSVTSKRSRNISESSSHSNNSDDVSDTPRRLRKSVNGFKKSACTSDVEVANIIETKRTRNTVSTPSKFGNSMNELEPVTPKRTRKSILRFGEPMDSSKIDMSSTSPKKRPARKTSISSYSNDSDSEIDTLKSVTPKYSTRKSVHGFGKLACTSDVEVANIIESKHTRKTSVSTPSKSRNSMNKLESMTSKRTRKSIHRFSESVDSNKVNMLCASLIKKSSQKKSVSSSNSSDSDSEVDTLKSVSPKRTTRKSVNGFGKFANKSDVEVANIIETKRTRKTSVSTPSKSRNSTNELEPVTSKQTRKSTHRYTEARDLNKINISKTKPRKRPAQKTSTSSYSSDSDSEVNTLKSVTPKRTTRQSVNELGKLSCTSDVEVTNKRTRKTSVSTPSKSTNVINTLESVESVTPKRTKKPVSRYGESVDFNDMEIENTPKSLRRSRKISVNSKDDDFDLENEWKTPVNKHNRLSCTPTLSGSRVRRSILPNIPENKEIDIVSTPKTPKKTPKTHVKNLTASVSKRLDCGVRVPCSPLEKARANLHLHAAPKHLPCREVEFKSIHSFLSRKINDELTGSMYISGVPGTGKTATVKRVIDSLNSDLIMKHSFKFIEINGLKLANPHQAFSVIWKELTAETVSSSRAQVLLDNYFSGNEVRELSTILLVDEVDHICNRKQDVVYNILDWPSRTGSKVVVITIANTMDLPERVLRGCVTSRMGLTRLVFKPYTFQQLQEIIMNRLIGNSSFDPDAVQLVARKVAAVSGDARRALDICRRAIDLIKDDDDTQLITINHVNQVLNSILTGVRVTAIRYCSLFEQFFLRALRDETIRTGFDHSTIYSIYNQMKSICLLEGEELPNDQQVVMMAYRLRDNGLIFLEKKRWDLFRKVSLNVSPEDISYALDKYNN